MDFGQLTDEDFLNMGDLSELSDDDIRGPINVGIISTQNNSCNPDHAIGAVLASPASGTSDGAVSSKNSGLLSCHDEYPGFDWLPFGDEAALIYGVSSFDVEFLSNCDSGAFVGSTHNGPVEKQSIRESKSAGCIHQGHNYSYTRTQAKKQADMGAVQSLPAKARSKRPRSVMAKTWTAAMLWNSHANSPTESLESEISHLNPSACAIGIPNNLYKSGFRIETLSLKDDGGKNGVIEDGHDGIYGCTSGKKCRKARKLHSKVSKKHVSASTVHNDAYKGDDGDDDALSEREASTRRCTHCLSNKTPQWRAGPRGPKTLCNACGVRYKSGRLFDEYRPAKSPTFVSFKHSNSHKKVVEMRRRKGLDVGSTASQVCVGRGCGAYRSGEDKWASMIASLAQAECCSSGFCTSKLKLTLSKDNEPVEAAE